MERFTFRRPNLRKQGSVNIAEQDSIDYAEAMDKELSNDELEKALKEFRDEGGRYEYNDDHRNHFAIKHW